MYAVIYQDVILRFTYGSHQSHIYGAFATVFELVLVENLPGALWTTDCFRGNQEKT